MLIENNFRGGILSLLGDRYEKVDEIKKTFNIDANKLYGWAMSEVPPHDESKIDRNVKLHDILKTADDSDIGYFVEVQSKYPDKLKNKTKIFHFCPEKKISRQDKFSKNMNALKRNIYTANKKLIPDWTDKTNYLVCYRILNFYVRYRMIVDKVHEILSFRQSKWLQKYISFNTRKQNQDINNFEKEFYKLLNNAFYGKAMENVRNRIKMEFKKED